MLLFSAGTRRPDQAQSAGIRIVAANDKDDLPVAVVVTGLWERDSVPSYESYCCLVPKTVSDFGIVHLYAYYCPSIAVSMTWVQQPVHFPIDDVAWQRCGQADYC